MNWDMFRLNLRRTKEINWDCDEDCIMYSKLMKLEKFRNEGYKWEVVLGYNYVISRTY